MGAADAAAVASALALEEGFLRDVYVSCEGVAAGAVANSGSDYFLHVHSNEYNVYDFTAWVSGHPGGMDPIKQWTSHGFQLVFPSWHPMGRFLYAQSSYLEYIGRLGDTVGFDALSQGLQSTWTVGYESCGSPGEVANDPSLGHHFSFYTDVQNGVTDTAFEEPYWRAWSMHSKHVVWTMLALEADDQLRQRAAWALSQILVTSRHGASEDVLSEAWLTYYDIFVRNAFGNYRDVLREVTYNPIMGEYLSFRGSRSLDADGAYPDENYAREIMQLFTIGLWELHQNGTRKTDADGNYLPTYSNDDITSFARVFTGFSEQPPRLNIEEMRGSRNFVDPMYMNGAWHDVYPKMDLDGNYLGDGYPLCSDLPLRGFLLKGARYRFVGYAYSGADLIVLSPNSSLYAALSQTQLSVELNSTISCTGAASAEPGPEPEPEPEPEECVASSLRVVQVGTGYYQYVQPTCVHLYFFNGQVSVQGMVAEAGRYQHAAQTWRHTCRNPDTAAAGISCCKGCSNYFPQGMTDQGYTCENMPETLWWILDKGCQNNGDWWANNKWCQLTCWEQNASYLGDNCSVGFLQSQNVCGYYQEKASFSAASARCESLGMRVCEQVTNGSECGQDGIHVWTPSTCTVSVEVRADGQVASQWDSRTQQNPIRVAWDGGFPTLGNCSGNGSDPAPCTESASGCICPICVAARAVFSAVPDRAQLLGAAARLRIGAFPPSGPAAACLAPCDGEVKAYVASGGGSVDVSTVFECDGVYYKNMESVVEVAGYSFRNPPVFTLYDRMTTQWVSGVGWVADQFESQMRSEAALAEVEALLDHLVHHPNVPPFVSYRLIQRMVTSNPTPAYVSAVAEAFSTGVYNGETYSGEYGDLGATFAAILLHPEARGSLSSSSVGKLREPMVKLLHFLRSMEFRDLRGRQVLMDNLENDIGQFPYNSPSVFNFYSVEYVPAGFSDGLVAPEFEIFTPPYALAWLNGMLSLVDTGGLTQCEHGLGQHVRTCADPEGNLSFSVSGSSSASDIFNEVSLLLTGGRISDTRAFDAALEADVDGDHLKAAMRTVIMSPEFHTLGEPALTGERPVTEEEPSQNASSYKAIVFLFLNGGADTYSLLVPMCDDLYQEYLTVRSNVALSQGELLGISADTQNCSSFGVHHALGFVHDLYTEGHLAFVANIGGLVQPVAKEEWRTAPTCAGLFSHSDQQNGGMTLKCQVQGTYSKGFGGRLADALAAEGFLTSSFSIAGSSTWSVGYTTSVEVLDGWNGAVRMQDYQELQAVVGNITALSYGNVYTEGYAQQLAGAIRSSERLGALLEATELATDSFGTTTSLARQLNQVAKLISTRTARSAERDLFFVEMHGFDTHFSLTDTGDRFAEIDAALADFVAELKAQDVFNSVVLVSSSDFGRTLTSNGQGTDHGWAGNHFVLGGSIRGGRIYNEFHESLLEGSSQDVGRGRMIPRYPWESVMVPIAQWFSGQPSLRVDLGHLSSVFPNLNNFNESEHIISVTSLFAAGYDVVAPTPAPPSLSPTPLPTQAPTPLPTYANGAVWAKIYQIMDGPDKSLYSFPLTTEAYGDIRSAPGSSNAKLSDSDINARATARDGYSHIYQIKSSDCPEYLYVKTNDTYVDTSASFGLTKENTLVGLGSSYESVPTWSTLQSTALGIDLVYTSPWLASDTGTGACCRYMFGHHSTDCWSGPSGHRCVSGGGGCSFKKLDDVVFHIYWDPTSLAPTPLPTPAPTPTPTFASGASWNKIYQIQDGSDRTLYSFPLTAGAYGDMSSAVGSGHAKLSDSDINSMALEMDGYSHIYQIRSSDCPHTVADLYVKTNDTYVDTSASFGLTKENTLIGLGTSYHSVTTWATLLSTTHGIDLVHSSPSLDADSCCRFFFGHGATDCWNGPSGYRCVNGGSGCSGYRKLEGVRFYIYSIPPATLSPTPSPTPSPTQVPTSTPTSSPTILSTQTVSTLVVGATEVRVLSTAGFNTGDNILIEGGGNSETGIIDSIQISRVSSASASGGILLLASGLANSYPIDSSVTLFITAAPTSTPTPTFPNGGPAGGGGGATATGDPHLRNVHGQRFDLMKPGRHILINIPKQERDVPFLRVQALAQRLGGCTDMYFQELNISGSWAESRQQGGYQFTVLHRDAETLGWIGFGKVEMKVVHGRTRRGLDYLNFYVRHLGQSGYPVGGLLGDDDHTEASAVPQECRRMVAVYAHQASEDGPEAAETSPSDAVASLE
ncbi:unnamed protein product [Prorocentrum cordatum]|uniref:Uncharacterized protein n=1 Tax=Prorocentrum cordatum TaxID=2364126 RepID=A0ABN9PNB5_9DINO|nr:unnamed protein product [Polarella glacialis]